MTWPLVTLDDLQADERRAITDGPFGSNLASRHYTNDGPRVVRLQNIGDGHFIDERAHISEQHFASLRAHEVRAGDLLVASLGEVLPRACLAPASLGPAIVKADCIRVRLRPDVEPRWVLYSMQRPEVRRWADTQRHGVGRPRLGLKVIRQIPVPLPPLGEQRRIVELLEDHLSRLDAADAYIRSAGRRLAALERSTLDEHFGGLEVPLGDLIEDISAGKSFGGASAPAREGEWGIIKVSAMTWGEFAPDENKAVSAERVDPRFEIHEGDLLVSRANTDEYVGASVLVGPVRSKLLLSDKSLRLTLREGVHADWLWRALQAPTARRQISALATGTKESMRNISQDSLRRVLLPRASEARQEAAVGDYAEVASAIGRARASTAAAGRRHAALRRSLLAAAFSGRLATPDVSEATELGAARRGRVGPLIQWPSRVDSWQPNL